MKAFELEKNLLNRKPRRGQWNKAVNEIAYEIFYHANMEQNDDVTMVKLINCADINTEREALSFKAWKKYAWGNAVMCFPIGAAKTMFPPSEVKKCVDKFGNVRVEKYDIIYDARDRVVYQAAMLIHDIILNN